MFCTVIQILRLILSGESVVLLWINIDSKTDTDKFHLIATLFKTLSDIEKTADKFMLLVRAVSISVAAFNINDWIIYSLLKLSVWKTYESLSAVSLKSFQE